MKPLSVESFHAVLFCRRWDACVGFYQNILGWTPVDEKPGFVEFRVAGGSHIGLLEYTGNSTLMDQNSFILTFRVENIDEFHGLLSTRWEGVTAVKRHPWGARIFELRDPEQRRLEFWTPL